MKILETFRNLILFVIDKIKEHWQVILKGIGVVGFLITTILYYIYYVSNEETLSTFSIILNLTIVFLVSLSILYYSFSRTLRNMTTIKDPSFLDILKNMRTPLKLAFVFLIVLFITIFSTYYLLSFRAFGEGFSYMFLASLTMIFIGFVMYSMIQYVSKMSSSGKITYFSLLPHLPFLLICSIYDLFNHIRKDIKNTHRFYFYLLISQFILVLLYYLIPYIIKKIYTMNSKLLLNEPVYLDKSQSIGSFNDFQEYHKKDENSYYSYSISCWVYIDNQPYLKNKREYVSILNYGNKPRIEYNVYQNRIRIVSMEGNREKIIYNKNIVLQKWNHIVLNYDKGSLDIFLNGRLVGTSINMIDNGEMSVIDIGEVKGLQGGICNVVYYPRRLTSYEISLIYWIFSSQRIPTL